MDPFDLNVQNGTYDFGDDPQQLPGFGGSDDYIELFLGPGDTNPVRVRTLSTASVGSVDSFRVDATGTSLEAMFQNEKFVSECDASWIMLTDRNTTTSTTVSEPVETNYTVVYSGPESACTTVDQTAPVSTTVLRTNPNLNLTADIRSCSPALSIGTNKHGIVAKAGSLVAADQPLMQAAEANVDFVLHLDDNGSMEMGAFNLFNSDVGHLLEEFEATSTSTVASDEEVKMKRPTVGGDAVNRTPSQDSPEVVKLLQAKNPSVASAAAMQKPAAFRRAVVDRRTDSGAKPSVGSRESPSAKYRIGARFEKPIAAAPDVNSGSRKLKKLLTPTAPKEAKGGNQRMVTNVVSKEYGEATGPATPETITAPSTPQGTESSDSSTPEQTPAPKKKISLSTYKNRIQHKPQVQIPPPRVAPSLTASDEDSPDIEFENNTKIIVDMVRARMNGQNIPPPDGKPAKKACGVPVVHHAMLDHDYSLASRGPQIATTKGLNAAAAKNREVLAPQLNVQPVNSTQLPENSTSANGAMEGPVKNSVLKNLLLSSDLEQQVAAQAKVDRVEIMKRMEVLPSGGNEGYFPHDFESFAVSMAPEQENFQVVDMDIDLDYDDEATQALHWGIIEEFEEVEPVIPREMESKRNYRRRESSQSEEQEAEVFSKLPNHYTVLATKDSSLPRHASFDKLKNSRNMDFNRDPSPERAEEASLNKIPSYYSLFTNSSKYDYVGEKFAATRPNCSPRPRNRNRRSGSSPRRKRFSSPSPSSYSRRDSMSSGSRSSSRSYGHYRSRSRSRSGNRSRNHSRNRSPNCSRDRSRHRSRDRSRNRSRDHSRDHYARGQRHRSSSSEYSDHYDYNHHHNNQLYNKRHDLHKKEIEERRVVYVGGIPTYFTRTNLKLLFGRFGEIERTSVHMRQGSDNYGFVTFRKTADAFTCLERGNRVSGCERFDLCFGGRRQFCGAEYSDLDGQKEDEEEMAGVFPVVKANELTYDQLLRSCLERTLENEKEKKRKH